MLGRPWFELSWLRRHAGKVRRSEEAFARYGMWLLLVSRVIPGTRLPTFLAAGFLRMPWLQFLSVMGVASFFWTAVLLWAVAHFGAAIADALGAFRTVGWVLVVLVSVFGFWLVRARARARLST
jgi:membrane protein DedA with SNARE-associated domain